FLLGRHAIAPNDRTDRPTPAVDAVRPVGGDATIFQRINDAGDMLRIATTVAEADGRRAIGTFIPARQDDHPNAVIDTVLAGNVFVGRAFVVNRWCIAAYEPIRENGRIIGMLFVGLPEKDVVDALLARLARITIGRTGYVYILRGTGPERGRYVLSRD